MRWLIIVALCVAGCGGSPTSPSPTPRPVPAPTPTPAPAPAPPPTFTGTVTDTVSGAPVAGYTAVLVGSRVTISAPGYLTRETQNGPRVDLIRDAAPFSLAFYRQFVRNEADAPSTMQPLRRLTQAPSIYLQATGLTPATIAALEHAARTAVYEFSGRTIGAVTFESGLDLRADRAGWIIVEQTTQDPYPGDGKTACGRAWVGASLGHVWLITARPDCRAALAWTLLHEMGHAMGFYHVTAPRAVMVPGRPLADMTITAAEQYHSAIAYRRAPGNQDVDRDSVTAGFSAPRLMVD